MYIYLYILLTDKRGIDGRLASAQTALMLQEETIRRNERERKTAADKIATLERAVASLETDKRQQSVCGQIYEPKTDKMYLTAFLLKMEKRRKF